MKNAILTALLTACALWTITYFALLLWAVFTDSGIGGPLAYPAGLFFFFLASTAAGLVLLLPSTALAEWFARRRGFPILAQIPLSVAALASGARSAAAVPGSPFDPLRPLPAGVRLREGRGAGSPAGAEHQRSQREAHGR